ncbi:hypothetical protein [Plantactinospora sp. KBS50]|uniref:hypothetical protein n=1 Tax=Plantactinospora sp. KBS50 TaxID=2024580 RepID=UPI0012FE6DAA|nr:hypothetical protein [Plantactinospora sp. KBS50]
MTVLDRVGHPAATATRMAARRRAGRAVLAALPWLLVLAALVAALLRTGTPAAAVAGYAVYWLALVLPGTLVHRALRGSRGNLPEDLGYGAAVGLLLELAAWACATGTGQQHLLRWWPAPVLAVFLAVPRLRRHWRIAERRPAPPAWTWAMAGVLLLIIGWAALFWLENPLPPVGFNYYQDLLYHLGLVQELTRTMPFEVPQYAGESLRYHYLSDAHLASAGLSTGIAPATVLLRLWIVPVAATAALVTAGFARELTGAWRSGPLAAAGAYVGLPLALGAPIVAYGNSPLSFGSPSQTYALPFLVVLAGLCVDVVRGRSLGAGWVLLAALGFACTGAKSSALPPLLAGLLLAGVLAGWRRRRVPWPAVLAVGTLVLAMLAGFRLFAGGGAGTLGIQPLSLLRWIEPYAQTVGAGDGVARGGLLPPGLAGAQRAGWVFAAGVVGWWLVAQSARLVGVLALAGRGPRADPAVWLLAGTALAGTGAAWLCWHPSASQLYFFLCALPFGVLLTVNLLVAARPPWRVLGAGLAVGAAAQALLPDLAEPERTVDAWSAVLTTLVVRALVLVLGAALVAVVAARVAPAADLAARWRSRRSRGQRPAGPAPESRTTPDAGTRRTVAVAAVGAVAALLGAGVAAGAEPVLRLALHGPAGTVADKRLLVTADEMRAALWLDAHAADDDVVATNVHCVPVRTVPHCDARAFWVTGLGGHRAVVESWGYTDETVAANGRFGLKYPRQPAPDAQRYELNERAFTAPTPAVLDRLRREYGVRWLLADTRAGPVSPDLARLARTRLVRGPVTVYALP